MTDNACESERSKLGLQVGAASSDRNSPGRAFGTFNPLFPNDYYLTIAGYSGPAHASARRLAMSCGCANACTIHGHDHARAWSAKLPVADLRSFWGALGCACWAV